jgi:hypothetical protein
VLKLETSRARVFDDEIRSLATELRTLAGDSVWAKSLESAKETSRRLEVDTNGRSRSADDIPRWDVACHLVDNLPDTTVLCV